MRAIIVGSAASLLNNYNGYRIDSYDYVIRPVTSLIASGYEKYVGSRTDMFWVTFQYLARLSLLQTPSDILCAFASDDEFTECSPSYRTAPIYTIENRFYYDKVVSLNRKKIKDIYFMPQTLQPELCAVMGYKQPHSSYARQKLRVSATTGVATIAYVLRYMNFSSVTITGFDSYSTGFYWNDSVCEISKRPFPHREYIYLKKLIREKKIYEL